jgi:transcriptional regulator with XRE-family HTH domain
MPPVSPPPRASSPRQGMFVNLGRILRLFREMRGFSQGQVAREAGVGRSQLSKYERGTTLPTLDSLERLLEVLGFRQDAFFLTVALLDRLPAVLASEPGAPVALVPTIGSLPAIDQAFEAAMGSLLALQRSVFEGLLARAAPKPAPRG